MNLKKLTISLVSILGLFLSSLASNSAQAAVANHVVINEVYYDVQKDYPEWIELYNPTDADLDISNWSLSDNKKSFEFDPGSEILAKDYLVVTKSKTLFLEKYGFSADFEYNLILNDDGDQVILKNSSGDIIDAVVFETVGIPEAQPHPGVKEGHSIERQPKGEDTDNCEIDFVDQPNPSPFFGLPNIVAEITGVDDVSVEVSWTKNSDEGFDYYEVFSSSDQIDWDLEIEIDDQDETSFLVEGLDPGETIYLKICVTNLEGEFWCSNVVSATTDIEYSRQVIINELFPRPSEGSHREFIELYNSSNQAINIGGWFLDDEEGGSKTYEIPVGTEIKAKSYLVFYKSETGIALNDSGDKARLLWPDDGLCSESDRYSSIDKDLSWSREDGGGWSLSTTKTPGAKNKITEPKGGGDDEGAIITDIAGAKSQPKNTWVRVEGIVTATPGLFGKRVMYIQDASGGIKIYFYKALWPHLKIGDLIAVFGKISTTSGEFVIRLYDSSAIVIISPSRAPPPRKKKIKELEGNEGLLVTISGRVVRSAGSTVWISDGTGTVRIYYYKYTGIKKLGLKKGDWITVTGILSRTSSGLRILPRGMYDLKIVKVGKSKSKKTYSSKGSSGQIFGAEKAHAAEDYRGFYSEEDSSPTKVIGWTLLIIGVILFGALIVSARLYGKNNQIG